jgi:hypothetical protein
MNLATRPAEAGSLQSTAVYSLVAPKPLRGRPNQRVGGFVVSPLFKSSQAWSAGL